MSSKVKEEEKNPAAHINVTVNGQATNHQVFFRIKRTTKFKKLMDAYCDRQSLDINSVVFLYDGNRFNADQTPDDLQMEDGDQIDCMGHQIGGRKTQIRRMLDLRILKT